MAKPKLIRIRYLVPMASPDESFPAGVERDCEAAEAARLIEAGFAEPVPKPTRGRRKATA